MRGHSLLQWTTPGQTGAGAVRSIQMETEIAEHLARAANERGELIAALEFYANPETHREQETGIGCFPGPIHADQGDKARAVLFRANRA